VWSGGHGAGRRAGQNVTAANPYYKKQHQQHDQQGLFQEIWKACQTVKVVLDFVAAADNGVPVWR